MAHQIVKEALAVVGSGSNVARLGSVF